MKKFNTSIFIFRRDYRLHDNISLIISLQQSNIVIPIFIFTPQQLVNNEYKSNNCVQFMVESLQELNNDLKKVNSRLFFFYGEPHMIIQKIVNVIEVDALFTNRDYSPYSKMRDELIKTTCTSNNIHFLQFEDALLHDVGSIVNSSGTIYIKFTPYFNQTKKVKVTEPIKNYYKNYYNKRNKIKGEYISDIHKFYKYNDNISVHGSRIRALKILNDLDNFKHYNVNKNFLSMPTTKLSAYIKFGLVSIREVYHKFKQVLGPKNDLLKQLYWRDFYYNILEYYPNILSNNLKQKYFKDSYKSVPFITYKTANKQQKEWWDKWTNGTTGFPLVDAAMRELNVTGFMHNRGRMIVASLLTKNMFFHYAEGEKYFAQHLVDYDPANNNGGWQWTASTGTDSMPYFRVFNPFAQSKKYDPDCTYIKKWIPELKNVLNDDIHTWSISYKNYDTYYEPMLDYTNTKGKCIKLFRKYIN